LSLARALGPLLTSGLAMPGCGGLDISYQNGGSLPSVLPLQCEILRSQAAAIAVDVPVALQQENEPRPDQIRTCPCWHEMQPVGQEILHPS